MENLSVLGDQFSIDLRAIGLLFALPAINSPTVSLRRSFWITGYPSIPLLYFVKMSWQLTGLGERGTVRLKCLAQEQNARFLVGSPTWTARSGYQHVSQQVNVSARACLPQSTVFEIPWLSPDKNIFFLTEYIRNLSCSSALLPPLTTVLCIHLFRTEEFSTNLP